ncbi:MAG: TatD family hydrolase [Ferruginibacter sp.]|nr:TatD family hydrolase [Ferruginibacter sp.]
MLINIHSHHHALNNNQWVIQNLFEYFEEVENIGNYSIGLHPWYLKQRKWEDEFETLKKYADTNFVVALGECGLDKSCTTDFSLQKEVFSAHITLANKLNKPLIIHCVNAYEEIIQVLKINRNNVPVIFHGFNKKENTALSLIKEGFFLSFGKAILNENIQTLLRKIPGENIFFETDDDTITIEEIYATAEKVLSIDTEVLHLHIKKNAIKLFGDGLFQI